MRGSEELRHPRIEASLPARCTVVAPGAPRTRLEGTTRDVGPGGAMLVLPTCLPPDTRLTVRLGAGPELPGQVVWAGAVPPTEGGTATGHGIAFTREVEAAVLRELLTGSQGQRYSRVPTRFSIDYSDLEKSGMGTCLNLSQSGMFIATSDLLCTGQDLLVLVAPPRLLHTFSFWSRVVWTTHAQSSHGSPAGIGVRFVKLGPTEATHLSILLEKLQSSTAPLLPASLGLTPV
ncbi:MAG: PilZ domain-containing protein [Candidatus Methylomirabilales bacterium]